MKFKSLLLLIFGVALLCVLTGCASFRSDIHGQFQPAQPIVLTSSQKVKVAFIFNHYKQWIGYDPIPKLGDRTPLPPYYQPPAGSDVLPGLKNPWNPEIDFDDIFKGALKEISNIESYSTLGVST